MDKSHCFFFIIYYYYLFSGQFVLNHFIVIIINIEIPYLNFLQHQYCVAVETNDHKLNDLK